MPQRFVRNTQELGAGRLLNGLQAAPLLDMKDSWWAGLLERLDPQRRRF